MQSTRYSCHILTKLDFFRQIIEKFKKIRPVGANLFRAERRMDGQTDRHDDDKNRVSQFCY
jgi:hypothetical protein